MGQPRPRVLLDCDGVLADFLNPALQVMNNLLGTNAKLEDMKTWYLFDSFDFKVTREQREACYDIWKQPGWCLSLPVYPGAKDGVARLREIADVYICTTPMDGDTWPTERTRWVKKHFGLDRRNVIHTDGKYVCAGDVLVDDKTEHCEAWGEGHPDGLAIRWAQVTNRAVPYSGMTIGDWHHLYDVVSTIKPGKYRRWTHRTT